MKRKFLNRLLAGIFAFTLICGSVPISAYASELPAQPTVSSTDESTETGEIQNEETGEESSSSDASVGGESQDIIGSETIKADPNDPAKEEMAGGEGSEESQNPEKDKDPEKEIPSEEITGEGESQVSEGDVSGGDASQEIQEEEVADHEMAVFFVNGFQSETHDVFKHTESVIAPGVEQYINYAYSKDGKQMVYYVATADISRDDVLVHSAYKDAQCTNFGMDKLTSQMAAANAKYTDKTSEEFISEYYTAVVGTNGDFYNMTTGQPSGAFVMNGVMSSNKANNRPWFAVFEDGTALCGANNADWDAAVAAHGAVQQAVGGSQVLLKDGQDITMNASGSYNTDRHSRTMVGVTADGKVVMAVLDGRQEPFSCGGTMHELAQIMLEAGCVSAINLDGGGSTTYVSRPEGSDGLQVVNRPSDGSERSISSGLIIASTAAPSNVFDHASLTAEENYVTPGSAVKISAVGVSPAGTAAGIPEDVMYTATCGTVDANGVFTSDGTVGDAVIQMLYNGSVVGETIVHVVIPETFEFAQPVMTLPYGKTIAASFKATFGLNEVVVKESDVTMTAENPEAVSFDGFHIIACDEAAGIAGTKIMATLSCAGLTTQATLSFGKGSEVIQDFEDFAIPGSWSIKTGYPQYGPAGANGQNEKGSIEIVTAGNGKVHSGDNALAIHVDMTQLYETGYHLLNLNFGADGFRIPAEATAFGFWMYVPEDTEGLYARWNIDTDGTGKADYTPDFLPIGLASTYLEPGWHYYNIDLSQYHSEVNAYTIQIYVSDRDNSAYNYYFKNQYSVDSKFTLYMDDITVDFSSVVEDREAPVFTSVRYADQAMSDAAELKGQTVTDSMISFGAMVHEDTEKDNYTGIDDTSAKAYIDGIAVDFTYAGGIFAIQDAVLADGVHTVAFEIADKMGNTARVSRKINVAANKGLTYVNLVPQTPDADKIPIGSVQWYDLKTNAIEKIDSITTVLNLNAVSNWELEGMTMAKGFEASYTIDKITNDATITIARVGDVDMTGDAAIASIPVRTWVSTITKDPGYESSTPDALWKRKIIWPKDIKISADYGYVKFADGTEGSFSSDRYQTITELYGNYAALNANGDYTGKTSWHVHTADKLADQTATCAEAGYTNRTYCAVCQSVVEWGTTVPATGHSYDFIDGVLRCTICGITYTGVWTDGREYVDGVAAAEGWNGNYYYVDGTRLTGVQKVPDPEGSGEYYYNFAEDGTCTGKYTGVFYDRISGVYRYSQLGTLSTGWKTIDDDWYYFRNATGAAQPGDYTINGITYHFEEDGKLASGVWVTTEQGTKYSYGPKFYYHGWQTIDGETYFFDNYYRYEGYHYVIESNSHSQEWYDFGENGALVGRLNVTQFMELDGKRYYVKDGFSQKGLCQIDGDYYYFKSDYTAATGNYYVTFNNGLMPSGMYAFGADGRMLQGVVAESDGSMYYYQNGVKVYAGLVLAGEDYYYVNGSCKVVTGKYYVTKTNGLMEAGYYEFGADGKLQIGTKNGIVAEDDGTMYYYENGTRVYAGLIQVGEDYYYVNGSCKVVTGKYYVTKTNGLMEAGYYEFGADGKLQIGTKNGIVAEADGTMYYYENGIRVYAGLIQVGEDYYYVNGSCKVVTGKYYVTKTNGLMAAGYYEFGSDGKLERDEAKDGIVAEADGTMYYYENGTKVYAGLIQVGEDYYYVNGSCKVVTGRYYVTRSNGLIEPGYYEFGVDGKMVRK